MPAARARGGSSRNAFRTRVVTRGSGAVGRVRRSFQRGPSERCEKRRDPLGEVRWKHGNELGALGAPGLGGHASTVGREIRASLVKAAPERAPAPRVRGDSEGDERGTVWPVKRGHEASALSLHAEFMGRLDARDGCRCGLSLLEERGRRFDRVVGDVGSKRCANESRREAHVSNVPRGHVVSVAVVVRRLAARLPPRRRAHRCADAERAQRAAHRAAAHWRLPSTASAGEARGASAAHHSRTSSSRGPCPPEGARPAHASCGCARADGRRTPSRR
jgi:hypothetical protein